MKKARPLVVLLLAAATAAGAEKPKVTYDEARRRIPVRSLPAFWIGDVADLPGRWAKLTRAEVRRIAVSPGGRPLHLIAYGQKERCPRHANFNSAIGGRDPTAYMDKASRQKPVVYFVGPVHGHEVEGLTGLVSLIQVMETGRDLRGRAQPELRRLGDRCRLLIVPAGNPDGIARFEPRAIHGMPLDVFQFWAMGTWSDDTVAMWPDSKRQHPRTGPRVGYLGCYFNDAGINPMHDEFFVPMGPEAPAILKVAMQEGPDLAVSLHSHGSAPALLRPAYVPLEVQDEVRRLALRCYGLLEKRGLPRGGAFRPAPEQGNPPAPFNLVSALYHISGATAFTFECPHGVAGEKYSQVTFEQILDIQLTLYEAMLQHAVEEHSRLQAANGLRGAGSPTVR
ncbi:MAG TPA: hypothetical protein EYH34_11400 [Planctomycetes bacterium]|nr:hypothetical protein [Planctomycetota bacterium]